MDMNTVSKRSVAPYAISFLSIDAIATPFIIYINILVIWTIVEDQRLRTVGYNVLLAALALTDLLVGLVVQPYTVVYRVCLLEMCSHACSMTIIFGMLLMFFCNWSLNTLMIISLERHIAIHYPLSYHAVIDNKKVIVTAFMTWLLVPFSTLLFVRLTDNHYSVRKVLVVSIFAANVLVTIFTTIRVQLTAHQQRRSVAAQQAAALQSEMAEKIKEGKRALAVGMVVIATVGLYCPLIIAFTVLGIKGKELSSQFKYISITAGATLLRLQSLINPLILSLRLSQIRDGVKRKVFALSRRLLCVS